MRACTEGQVEAVRVLLEHGADRTVGDLHDGDYFFNIYFFHSLFFNVLFFLCLFYGMRLSI